jgi:hypothetical protein
MSNADKARQLKLEKARKEMQVRLFSSLGCSAHQYIFSHVFLRSPQDEFDRQKAQISAESSRDLTAAARFVNKADSIEDALKLKTIGLQRLEDFRGVRRELEEQQARQAAKTDELKWVPLNSI